MVFNYSVAEELLISYIWVSSIQVLKFRETCASQLPLTELKYIFVIVFPKTIRTAKRINEWYFLPVEYDPNRSLDSLDRYE